MAVHLSQPKRNVCRQLFPITSSDALADSENYFNSLQDDSSRQQLEKSLKWGFNFKDGVPLDGIYEWTEIGNGKYVGRLKEIENKVNPQTEETELELPVKKGNEDTPKLCKETEDKAPELRKRRIEDAERVGESTVRKRLTFE